MKNDCTCERCETHNTCVQCQRRIESDETRYHVCVRDYEGHSIVKGPLCIACRTKEQAA